MLPPSAFTPHLDGWLMPSGFVRRSKNPRYVRKLGTSSQRIDMALERSPRDHPTAEVAVYPWLEVSIPEIEREFTLMMGSVLHPRSAGSVLRQPIEFTSAKRASGRWYVTDAGEIPGVAQAIGQFIQAWTLPFLDSFRSTADVVKAARTRDDRVLRDYLHIWREVAATSLELGPTAAREFAESRFSAPGLRARYAEAFQHLHLRCQN